MNRPVKIGFLSPYSTIYPDLSYDMLNGLMSALPHSLHKNFRLVPEFVRQGEPAALRPAVEKLLLFEQVDLLTGLVGYRSVTELFTLIDRIGRPALFADLGEYLPPTGYQSENVFFNSFQYWQAEFALGKWAQRTFGGKGAIFMPVYDGGYHMHSAFRHGACLAGSSSLEYAVMNYSRDSGYSVTDAMQEYMQKFRKERPKYLHALFSGGEAVEFFSVYHREGLHKEIPLLVSPHMASYEVLRQVEHLDMTFYAASMWDVASDDPVNTRFRRAYLDRTGNMPNIFGLLGYEIGLMLEALFPYLAKRETGTVKKLLREERISTPRGERNFYLDSEYATPVINIEKIKIAHGMVRKIVAEQGQAMPYDHVIFDEIHRENISGWYNSYLCV